MTKTTNKQKSMSRWLGGFEWRKYGFDFDRFPMVRRWVGLILSGWLWSIGVAGAQPASTVRFEMFLGPSVGTMTEILSAPMQGGAWQDPHWVPAFGTSGALPRGPRLRLPHVEIYREAPGHLDLTDLSKAWPTIQREGELVQANSRIMVPLPFLLRAVTVKVPANALWVKTGVEVKPGDVLEIKAAGRWSMHFGERFCDPRGLLQDGPLGRYASTLPGHPQPACPLPDQPAGVLVGRIAGGPPFVVGEGGRFEVARSGEVELMANDVYDGATAPGQPCRFCHDRDGHLVNNEGELIVLLAPWSQE